MSVSLSVPVPARDPLRRGLLAVFLLIAVALLGTTALLGLGMLQVRQLSAESERAMAALLAADRVRRGTLQEPLPAFPGVREVEAAAARQDRAALPAALARYRQSVVEALVATERRREHLIRQQVVVAGILALATMAGLTGLLLWMYRLVLNPIERLDGLARRVIEGDLEPRAPDLPTPEFTRLGRSLNEMLDTLRDRMVCLEERSKAWEELLEAVPVPLVAVDARGAVSRTNSALRALAGAGLEGRDAREALPILSEAGESAWEVAPGEDRTWTLRLPSGDAVPVALDRVSLAGGEGTLVMLKDLRAHVRDEEVRGEVLELLGRELRAPLRRIAETAATLRHRELAGLALHAEDLADGLALAREVRTGRWRTKRRPVELKDLLEQVVQAHEGAAREKEVLLAPRLEEAWALADPPYLRLALVQVVARALDESRPGSKLGLSCWAGRGHAVVEVIPDDAELAGRLRGWLARRSPGGPELAGLILAGHDGTVEPGPADRVRLLLPPGNPSLAPAPEEDRPVAPRGAGLPEAAGSLPAAAALERDEMFGNWLRHSLGITPYANSSDLPRQGLEVLLLDLDHGPPVARPDLPRLPLLCVADHPERHLDRFLELGATGLVARHESAASMRRALDRVARGETVLCPEAAESLVERISRLGTRKAPREFQELTAREQEIFAEVVRGRSNREIADALLIAEGTVKSHVNSLLRKLDLRDRVQILLYAARHGLLPGGSEEL